MYAVFFFLYSALKTSKAYDFIFVKGDKERGKRVERVFSLTQKVCLICSTQHVSPRLASSRRVASLATR
jgi:hypothetical protein